MKRKIKSSKYLIHVFLLIGAISMVIPFFWMVSTSGKTMGESMQVPPLLWSKNFQWNNYSKVTNIMPFAKFYFNTFIVILVRIITTTITASMAAFAMAKLKFRGKSFVVALVIGQMMIPGQIYLIPQYQLARSLGILDSISALIMPGIVSAFGTFLLRQHYMSLPNALMESAKLDGATIWQIYSRIYLPISKPGLVSLGIYTSLFAYKDLAWPLVVNSSFDKQTLSSGLSLLNGSGQLSTDFPLLMAGSVLACLPMIILFLIFQNQFTQGIATTGTK